MTRSYESIEELFQRIVAEDARKHDVIADTRKMSVAVEHPEKRDLSDTGAHEIIREPEKVDESRIKVRLDLDGADGGEAFYLTDHALGQVSTDLQIPKRYFDKMKVEAPNLLQDNVHHWFYNQPKNRLVRGLKTEGSGDYTGRAFLSDRFRRLDNIEIARTLLPEFDNLGTPVQFHQAAVTENKLHIRALFPELERDVKKVGDTLRWGVAITNSEIGGGSLTITEFALRLACRNGLVLDKVLNTRHIGKREDAGVLSNEAIRADDVAFWLAARDELRAAVSETRFQTVVDRLEGLSETAVLSPVAATKVLQNEYALTDEETEQIMLVFAGGAQQAGTGQWGLLNAVTAHAQTVDSFDRQAELEHVGWQLAQKDERAWEKIALAVK